MADDDPTTDAGGSGDDAEPTDETVIVAGPKTDDRPPPPTSTPPTAAPPGPRRLHRSNDRMIAGVAGGIAEYFNIDPVIVRLGLVLATFAGGAGLVGYLIAWLVIPERAGDAANPPTRDPVDPAMVAAIALVVAAIAIGFADPFQSGFWLPLLLIGAGVYLLMQRPQKPTDAEPATPTTTPMSSAPAFDAPTDTFTGGSRWESGGVETPLPPPPRFTDAPLPPPPRPSVTEEPAPPPAPRPPSILTRLALSAIALTVAIVIVANDAGWFELDVTETIGIGLVIIGLATLASAFVGRGRGLIVLGILTTIAFGVSAAVEPYIDDGIGERDYAPASLDELEDEYRHGIGQLEVDLTAIEIPDGESRTVRVELGIGEAVVRVPALTDLELEGVVDVGELRILDEVEDGIRNEITVSRDFPDGGTLIIELDLGFGEGRITRG